MSSPNLKKAFVLSDLHAPYQQDKILDLVVKYAEEEDPDLFVLNGDMADCAAFSKFTLPLKALPWSEEKKIFSREMKKLDKFKKLYIYGNHEIRIVDAFSRDQISRIVGSDMELDGKDVVHEILGLSNLKNLQVVPYMGRVNLGSLAIKHGTYWRKDAGATARAERDKEGGSTLTGHTHRLGSSPKTFSGENPKLSGAWENGCLCQLRVWYKRGNSVTDEIQDWQQGFSVVLYEDKPHGWFNVQQYYIIDNQFVGGNGKIYRVR